jgi:hypothetical protein
MFFLPPLTFVPTLAIGDNGRNNKNDKIFYLSSTLAKIIKNAAKVFVRRRSVLHADLGVGGSVAPVEQQGGSRPAFPGAADFLRDQERGRTLAGGLPVRAADRVGKSNLQSSIRNRV